MYFVTRNLVWKFSLILIFFINFNKPYPEEVCKLFFNGYPEDLMDKELSVPDNTVGLSEYIKVGTPTIVHEHPPPGISIFFIIDNSASMTRHEKDRPANRFTVIYDMIDTIAKAVPKAEVGLAVFKQDLEFDVQDCPHFVIPPQWKRPYLKLLKVNETYEDNQTGADILRKYLDSEIGPDGIGNMKYKPTDPLVYWMYKTNINSGFDAAKDAMTKSNSEKHRQFIIFISDGEANQPQDGTKNNFAKGENVPTTFTIYFSKNKRVPQSIQLMTDNIKVNGYSASNGLSDVWGFDNSINKQSEEVIRESKAKLTKFLMDKIMATILRKVYSKPTGTTVNTLDPVSKWGDSIGYIFKEIFPLTGTTTNFLQKITYTQFYDSITQNQEVIKAEGEKTTQDVNFSVRINEFAEENENILFECWERKLQFFHNGTPIKIANETMKELEIRFIEDKVDMLYGYEDVKVEISNTKTNKTDLEKFDLKHNKSYFSYTFKRGFSSEPEQQNQKLDHTYEDSIIVVFRNPNLPLDTLRYGIPFQISGSIGIKTGFYYDNDADGYIDSIFLEYKGEVDKEQAEELVDFITLPAHRGFEILDKDINDDGIGLTVRQEDIEYDDKMVTYVTKEDILVLKDGILPSGGMVIAGDVEIKDRVAPIIMKADLVDFEDPEKDDILTVFFSEPVMKVTKRKPFYFWSSNADNLLYVANLRYEGGDATKQVFSVSSIEGVTEPVNKAYDNDSIWIYWKNKQVGDKLFNYQHNKKNRRRLLNVDQRYTFVGLIPKGVNPYDRNTPKDYEIPSNILEILKEDNVAEIEKGSHPNSGMLLRVIPRFAETVDMEKVKDFFLEGNVSIFDPTGNTVIDGRAMGFHKDTKSLNFVWNGRNTAYRACGTGPYLALFKVTKFRGKDKTNVGDDILKLIVYIK